MQATARAERATLPSTSGRAWSWDRPAQWLITLVTTALVLFPLVPILYQSVLDRPLYDAARAFTLANYTRILNNAEFWGAVATTILFVLGSTIIAVLIGTVLAVLLTRTDLPAQRLFNALVLVPFYV